MIPELTRIALDRTEPTDVRIGAARTLTRLGNEEQRAALRPLLDESPQDRWLIRVALEAVWPHALSAEKLFEVLREQPQLMTFGDTLVEHIRDTMTPQHLLIALRWILRRVQARPMRPNSRSGDAVRRLEDGIIEHAGWSDDDAITSALSEIAAEKIRRREALISRDELHDDEADEAQWMSDPSRRQRFASVLLPTLARLDEPIAASLVLLAKTRYLRPADLSWLVQRQTTPTRSLEERALEAKLILRLADLTVPSTFDLVWCASANNNDLARHLTTICAPVPLDSAEACDAREEHYEMLPQPERSSDDRAPGPPAGISRVHEWLETTERQPCKFWRVLEEMARQNDDDFDNSANVDVQTFAGWIAADENVRRRTLIAADRFIRECDPGANSWFGTHDVASSAMGGVRALVLLKAAAPQQFASLGVDIWIKWTPALLGIAHNGPSIPLLPSAYRHAPGEVIRRIQQLLRVGETHVVQKLTDVLDDTLMAAILEVVGEGGMQRETLTWVLQPLLHHPMAREFALSLIDDRVLGSESRATAVVVAATLLLHVPNESWEAIWPVISTDASFGKAVMKCAVSNHSDAAPVYRLDEDRVAALYLWLTREYPPRQDPARNEMSA